jgi:hypothetical protein
VQRLAAIQERGGRPEMPPRPMLDAPKPPAPACPMPPSCAKRLAGVLRVLVLLAIIINITLAVWVYGDVQKRGVPGRGIFIMLVLLAGIPMSILYALVRIGDKVGEKTS